MVTTLTQVAQEAASRFRRKNDTQLEAQWNGFVNTARRGVMNEHNFKEMETNENIALVVDQVSYPTPDGFKEFMPGDSSVRITKKGTDEGDLVIVVTMVPRDKFKRLVLLSEAPSDELGFVEIPEDIEGIPLRGNLFGDVLEVFPVVTDAALVASRQIEIDYYKKLPDLVGTGNDFLTDEYLDALVYRACMEAALFIQDFELRGEFQEFFADQMVNMQRGSIEARYSGQLLEMGG